MLWQITWLGITNYRDLILVAFKFTIMWGKNEGLVPATLRACGGGPHNQVYACPPKLITVYRILHATDKLAANTIVSQLTGQYIHLTRAMYTFLPKLTKPYGTRHATDDPQWQR